MKTKLLLLMLAPMLGCGYIEKLNKVNPTDAICILTDETDTMVAFTNFDRNVILPVTLINEGEVNQNGYIFKFSSIKNVGLSEEKIFALNATNSLSNIVNRKFEVDSFVKKIDQFIALKQESPSTIGNSAVFEKLSHELNWIKELNVDGKKTLIVFSDLRQNIPNRELNFYKEKTFAFLAQNPSRFDSIYLNLHPLPDNLEGIEIKLIYQPKDIPSDQIFHSISSRLESILEKKGAIVTISGSLIL